MTTAGVRIAGHSIKRSFNPEALERRKPIRRSSQAESKLLDTGRHFYEWYRLALSRHDRNLLQKGHISSRDEWHGNFK
jgi:hypothetical protein